MTEQRVVYFVGPEQWAKLNKFLDSYDYGHTHYLVFEYSFHGFLNYQVFDLRLGDIHFSVGPSDREGVQALIARLDRDYQKYHTS